MSTVFLDKNDVPAMLKGSYAGNKFKVVVTEKTSLISTYWSGGTKYHYSLVNMATGQHERIAADSAPAPFGKDYDGAVIELKPGIALVEHSIFCGRDTGLTFYIHPDNAGKFLPRPVELTEAEQCLLLATKSLKSSYAGRKPRLDMMYRNGFTDADADSAKQSLAAKGLLAASGAITTAGKNAAQDRSKFKM